MEDITYNVALYVDYANRKLISSDGSSFTLPPVTLGDRLRFTLRPQQRTSDGSLSDLDLPVRTLLASFGKVTEPPASGTFKLCRQTVAGVPAIAVFAAASAHALHKIFITDNGSTTAKLVAAPSPFSTLAASITYFRAQAAGFYALTDPDSDGNVNVTAALTTSGTRSLQVEYKDLDGATGTVNAEQITAEGSLSDSIAFDAPASAFAAAITPAMPSAPADTYSPAPGCWLFRLAGNEQETLFAAANRLDPAAFVRCRSFQRFGDEWWYEVRLIQAPLAWNEDGHERVLPPPPSVRRIRTGFTGSDTQAPINELQSLTIPAEFRGTYFLRWNYRVTRVLGPDDGPDEIAEALNGLFDDTAQRFDVTNPEPSNAYIEFLGPLAAAPQALATVDVNTFPPGTLTFEIAFDRAELCTALRAVSFIVLPFEVEIELGSTEHPESAGRNVTLFRADLRIEREEIFAELATVSHINWLTPAAARNYIPFTPDQIIWGSQHYIATFGDGASRSFSFPHNLHTSAFTMFVRTNIAGGVGYALATDYVLTFPSDDELVLTLNPGVPTPAADGLAIVISSAGPASAFQSHTHTIAQIVGLVDALASLTGRVESLEDLLPSATLTRRETRNEALEIVFLDAAEIFFGHLPATFSFATFKSSPEAVAQLAGVRPGAMLPACHDATVTDATELPGTAPATGNVIKNTGTAAFQVPSAAGRRSAMVEPNGFAAYDGRYWYRVTRARPNGSTASNSFFPTDFERELLRFHCPAEMWQPGEHLQLNFDLELQTVNATSDAQWVVIIEAGTATSQTAPSPAAPNLDTVTWQAVPLLEQRVLLSSARIKHAFGCLIKRSDENALTGEILKYTAWSVSDAAALPASPQGLVLRARLANFDTQNNVPTARGFVFYQMTNAKAQIN